MEPGNSPGQRRAGQRRAGLRRAGLRRAGLRRGPAATIAVLLVSGVLAACSSAGSAVTSGPATGSGAGAPSGFATPSSTPATSTATPTTGTPSPSSTASASSTTNATGGPAGGLSALRGKVIALDPGHNGGNATHPEQISKQVFVGNGYKACNTTGTATASGYAEHAFNWDLAHRLAAVLRANGARVILTRTSDTGVGPCVNERAAIGNRAHADLTLSLHADGNDAAGALGFHVIAPGSIGRNSAIVAPSRRLGLAIRDAFHAGTGEPLATYTARGGLNVRTDLGGLNMSTVPAVMIECGNLRNATDAARLSSGPWRQRAAQALATGLARYLATR